MGILFFVLERRYPHMLPESIAEGSCIPESAGIGGLRYGIPLGLKKGAGAADPVADQILLGGDTGSVHEDLVEITSS